MHVLKKIIVVPLTLALLAGVSSGVSAADSAAIDSYPNKTVKLVVPYGAGGGTDRRFRILASVMNDYMGQPVVIVNRGGGGGTVATTAVAAANPDGYELLVWHTGAMTIAPLTIGVTYDPLNDFEYVAQIFAYNNHIAVGAGAPFKDWPGFVDYAKANPRKVKFGLGDGPLGFGQLWIESILNDLGLEVTYVPFNSAGESFAAAAGGHVLLASGTYTSATSLVNQGKLIPLINTSTEEDFGYPGLAKFGLERFASGMRNGIVAPKGTPKEIVKKIEKAFLAAVKDKSFLALAERSGELPVPTSGEELRKFTAQSLKMMKKAVDKLKN